MKMNLTSSEKDRGMARFLLMSLLCCLLIFPAWAQERVSVSGRVTGSSKEPLVGASVIEKGTTNGVTTDAEGRYQISVKGTATLDFSYVGCKPQSLAVMNRTQIDVVLEDDAMMIGEVVAIGYGSQRKEDLSMAVTTVKLDDVAKSRAGDLATILQGRMPGVTIQQSGDPMKKASYSIRGRGSKGNDQGSDRGNDGPTSGDGVLFVVDGVPNAPFMTDDIETVTILKDAASAAIYGASVGSSGVVLITTKRAKSGQVRVDVNVSYGVEKISSLPSLLNAEEFNMVWKKAVDNNPGGKALPSAMNPELFPFGNVTRTNWLDEIFRTGSKQHYAASISGGSDKIQSVLSLSYDKTKGVLLNTYSESFGGKLQTDFTLTKWLKLSERVSFSASNGQGDVDTGHQGPIMGAMWYPRFAPVYEMNEDGSYALDEKGNRYFGGTTPKWAGVSGTPNIYNPVAYLERLHRKYPENKIFSTTSLEIKPISSLTIRSEFTADLRTKEEDEFYPVMKEAGLMRTKSNREQFFYRDRHWLSETTVSWAELFGKHHISAMAGFTADSKKTHRRSIFSKDYPEDKDDLLWDDANDWTIKPQERKYDYTMYSVLARVGYSFDDRYFLVGSIRRDASSKLPISKPYDWFPSVSGSWKLSSEKFFQNAGLDKVFDLVKFRAGWGKVGNVELYKNNVATAELLTYDWPGIFGQGLNQTITGTYLSTLPNLNARWETTEQTSAGLDMELFNNSLSVSVDYYHKVTKDLIDVIPTPEQIGVHDAPYGNMGNVLNRGWEFSVNYNGTAAHGKLNYNVWGIFSTNKGYVREYGIRKGAVQHKNPNLNSTPLLYSDKGNPWYSFQVYRTAGIFRSQDEIDKYIYKNPETGEAKLLMPDAKVGDLIFVDTNNDGVINDADQVLSGSYAPKNTFSFGASLNWKGFDFNFMFQGVTGNKIYNGTKQLSMNARDDYGNLSTEVLDTWDFNPEHSKYPRLGLTQDSNGNYTKFSDIFLEKGDYLRLKNVTLGYTLPKSVGRAIGLQSTSIRLYVSVDNAFTITGYDGIDPEVGNYGIDSGVYPVSRFYNFGVNINF